MEVVRAFENTDRCMQRLGFIKYLVAKCAQTDTSNLTALGKDLVAVVTRKAKAPLAPELYEYIKRRLTDPTYRELKSSITRIPEDACAERSVNLELQDLYLSLNDIPSKTGKLVAEDWRKFPFFASSLGLMRKGTYSPLVRGMLLLQLISQKELQAFKEYSSEINPFVLDERQRLLFLFAFLEHDGDVLRMLYQNVLEIKGEFTDREAGDFLPQIFRELAKRLRAKVRSGDDLIRVRRFLDSAANIEKWKGKPYTGESARGHAVTVRLEPFVDMGLLIKKDPFSYKYTLSKVGKVFLVKFMAAQDIDDFLRESFFKACNLSFSIKARKTRNKAEILNQLYQSYNHLKSPLGYAPIRDTALLAGIRGLVENKLYFEIDEAAAVLKKVQKQRPDLIRFNIDRMGNLTYVKFNADPSASLRS